MSDETQTLNHDLTDQEVADFRAFLDAIAIDWNTPSRLANIDSSTPIDPKALIDGMVEIRNKLGGKKPDRLIAIHPEEWGVNLYFSGQKRARMFMRETQRQRRELRSAGLSRKQARKARPRIHQPAEMPQLFMRVPDGFDLHIPLSPTLPTETDAAALKFSYFYKPNVERFQ